MEQKKTEYRTPAPIFAIKRPRQALFAHPANSFTGDENAFPELDFSASVRNQMPHQQPQAVFHNTFFNKVTTTALPLTSKTHSPLTNGMYSQNAIAPRISAGSSTTGHHQPAWNSSVELGLASTGNTNLLVPSPKASTSIAPRRHIVLCSQITGNEVNHPSYHQFKSNCERFNHQPLNPRTPTAATLSHTPGRSSQPQFLPTKSISVHTPTQSRFNGTLNSSMACDSTSKRTSSAVSQSLQLPMPNYESSWCPKQSTSSFVGSVMESTKRQFYLGAPNSDASGLAAFSSDKRSTKTASCSMRLVTSSVEGMKRWADYRTKQPVLFEVIGMLNSAVTGDLMSNKCVTFLLKDQTGIVQCSFYQIDRQLPRLNRGQWYRCVGRFNLSELPSLKCVSVRLATEAEKRNRETLVAASQQALQEFLHAAVES